MENVMQDQMVYLQALASLMGAGYATMLGYSAWVEKRWLLIAAHLAAAAFMVGMAVFRLMGI
jgi:hypothetical protein